MDSAATLTSTSPSIEHTLSPMHLFAQSAILLGMQKHTHPDMY